MVLFVRITWRELSQVATKEDTINKSSASCSIIGKTGIMLIHLGPYRKKNINFHLQSLTDEYYLKKCVHKILILSKEISSLNANIEFQSKITVFIKLLIFYYLSTGVLLGALH